MVVVVVVMYCSRHARLLFDGAEGEPLLGAALIGGQVCNTPPTPCSSKRQQRQLQQQQGVWPTVFAPSCHCSSSAVCAVCGSPLLMCCGRHMCCAVLCAPVWWCATQAPAAAAAAAVAALGVPRGIRAAAGWVCHGCCGCTRVPCVWWAVCLRALCGLLARRALLAGCCMHQRHWRAVTSGGSRRGRRGEENPGRGEAPHSTTMTNNQPKPTNAPPNIPPHLALGMSVCCAEQPPLWAVPTHPQLTSNQQPTHTC